MPRAARSIEQVDGRQIGGLKTPHALIVAVAHDCPGFSGMTEPNGVPNFVNERVAKIINLQVSIETDLPAHAWIEADICPFDFDWLAFVGCLE
jgi:hypothetical protein